MIWLKVWKGWYMAESRNAIHVIYFDPNYDDYTWESFKKTSKSIKALSNITEVSYPDFDRVEGLDTKRPNIAKRKVENYLRVEELDWGKTDLVKEIRAGMLRTIKIELMIQKVTYPYPKGVGN